MSMPNPIETLKKELGYRTRSPIFGPLMWTSIFIFWEYSITIIDLTTPAKDRITYIKNLCISNTRYLIWLLIIAVYYVFHARGKKAFYRWFFGIEDEVGIVSAIGGIKRENEKLSQEVSRLNQEKDGLDETLNEKRQEISSIQKKLTITQEEKNDYEEKWLALKKNLDDSKDEIKSLKESLIDEQVKASALYKTVNELIATIENNNDSSDEASKTKGRRALVEAKVLQELEDLAKRFAVEDKAIAYNDLSEQIDKILSRINSEGPGSTRLEMKNLKTFLKDGLEGYDVEDQNRLISLINDFYRKKHLP